MRRIFLHKGGLYRRLKMPVQSAWSLAIFSRAVSLLSTTG